MEQRKKVRKEERKKGNANFGTAKNTAETK